MIINAFVYNSEENKKYVAECYEIVQLGIGNNEREAEKDLVKTLRQVVEIAKEDKTIRLFDKECASEKCKNGLEKALKGDEGYHAENYVRGVLAVRFYR